MWASRSRRTAIALYFSARPMPEQRRATMQQVIAPPAQPSVPQHRFKQVQAAPFQSRCHRRAATCTGAQLNRRQCSIRPRWAAAQAAQAPAEASEPGQIPIVEPTNVQEPIAAAEDGPGMPCIRNCVEAVMQANVIYFFAFFYPVFCLLVSSGAAGMQSSRTLCLSCQMH